MNREAGAVEDVASLDAKRKQRLEQQIEARRLLCGDGCRGCAWCRRNTLRGVLDWHSEISDAMSADRPQP